jgi:hypothetical protein
MTDNLAQLIKRAYPTGTADELDDAALENEPRDMRLRAILHACTAECGLNFDIDFTKGMRAYIFHFTEKWHPTFDEWVRLMDNAAKTLWIQRNGGPYTVLLLQVSRVADYYYHYFNHWIPRGDTGYLDIDFKQPPNVAWAGRLAHIEDKLKQAGFHFLTTQLAVKKTPFVLERDYDAIPDNDPRRDDDKFEPPLVASTVHECLFTH